MLVVFSTCLLTRRVTQHESCQTPVLVQASSCRLLPGTVVYGRAVGDAFGLADDALQQHFDQTVAPGLLCVSGIQY